MSLSNPLLITGLLKFGSLISEPVWNLVNTHPLSSTVTSVMSYGKFTSSPNILFFKILKIPSCDELFRFSLNHNSNQQQHSGVAQCPVHATPTSLRYSELKKKCEEAIRIMLKKGIPVNSVIWRCFGLGRSEVEQTTSMCKVCKSTI